jgi:GNAT superfamily N-acetyltransferase
LASLWDERRRPDRLVVVGTIDEVIVGFARVGVVPVDAASAAGSADWAFAPSAPELDPSDTSTRPGPTEADPSASPGPPGHSEPSPRLLGIVRTLYVEPPGRAIGVGEAIMDMVISWCTSLRCVGIDAPALPGARHAKAFFEDEGFVARLLIMHRPLGEPRRGEPRIGDPAGEDPPFGGS